jgi:DNA-binding response OmpR family regulator
MTAGKQRILIVDDEEQVRTLLSNLFLREGYETATAATGAEMRTHLATEPFQLVTLDLNLGGEDGLALAREIRTQRDVAIVMISAKDSEIDRVVGLELGADDYIVKPFNLREVLARVRAVLRRSASVPPTGISTGSERYGFSGWTLDLGKRQLSDPAKCPVELTTAEFNLLEAFVKRPERPLSRDTLMSLLRGEDWSPLDRSIDTLVARLRKKIETDTEAPELIKTVRGVGYVFAADVSRL